MGDTIVNIATMFTSHIILFLVEGFLAFLSFAFTGVANYIIISWSYDEETADSVMDLYTILLVVQYIALLFFNVGLNEGAYTTTLNLANNSELSSTLGTSLLVIVFLAHVLGCILIILLHKIYKHILSRASSTKKGSKRTKRSVKTTEEFIRDDIDDIIKNNYPSNSYVYDIGILYYKAYMSHTNKLDSSSPQHIPADMKDPYELHKRMVEELPDYDLGLVISTTIKELFPSFIPLVTQYKETPKEDLAQAIKEILAKVTLVEYNKSSELIANNDEIRRISLENTINSLKAQSKEDLDFFVNHNK